MRSFFSRWLAGVLLALLSALAWGQAKLDKAQLDQMLAPIALYPDALLSQILMASTYPADVAAAAQWSKANPNLSGDAATKAVEGNTWDPSVKSLAAFPSVLDMMGRQPQWVQSLGDAFLDQPNDMMDAVQRLRRQAQQAGTLKSTSQQTVSTQSSGGTTVVQIAPANPQVVYVPAYDPAVVYGAWPYPAYPPYYYPPPPGSVFATSLVAGIGFGIGVAAVDSMWGGFDWGHNNVYVNVNRYNSINVNNRLAVNQNNMAWVHNPANRGAVPYRNEATRQRFDAQRQAGLGNRAVGAPALSQRDQARERAAQSVQQHTGQSIAGHRVQPDGRPGGESRLEQGGAGRQGFNPAAAQRQDHAMAQDRSRAMNRDSALRDAGNGERLRQQAQRPSVQPASFGGRGDGARLGSGGGGARPGGVRAGGAHLGGRR